MNPRDAAFWTLRLVVVFAVATIIARFVDVDAPGPVWLGIVVALALFFGLVGRAITTWSGQRQSR